MVAKITTTYANMWHSLFSNMTVPNPTTGRVVTKNKLKLELVAAGLITKTDKLDPHMNW
jgi:hypothetical protein